MNLLFMQNGLAPYGVPRNGLIALYDPGRQMLTGATGQTLIDFSGKGNSAQLGSTAGADTNDPSYSGAGLVFGTDDYAKSSSNVFDDMQAFTCITACKPLSAGGGSAGRIWDKASSNYAFFSSSNIAFILYRQTAVTQYTSVKTLSYGNNIILGITFNLGYPDNASKIYVNSKVGSATKSGAGSGSYLNIASSGMYIGNRTGADRNFGGTIYLQLWYNRILSDAEYMQAYNSLKRLMFSRGVVI